MKRFIYILISIVLMTSCQQEVMELNCGTAVLELDLLRAGRPTMTVTRAVDEDLVVDVLRQDGSLFVHYDAGQVERKIVLEPGTFTIRAYTDNQENWQSANGGKGESCYFAETTVVMEEDMVKRLQMRVPMTNYAVSLQLPDLWDNLFTSYYFTLKSGNRTVNIAQGEKAYFDLTDGGFSYALMATNTDGITHSHSAIDYTEVQAGRLFTIRYSYDSNANTGGVDIIITDDMGTNDTEIHL